MISYGASEHNLSILIHSSLKEQALNALNERLFYYEDAMKDILDLYKRQSLYRVPYPYFANSHYLRTSKSKRSKL